MNKLLSWVLFSLLLALGGCLELDGQDVVLRYDAEADRIDALIVHRGLFAEGSSGSSEDPMDKALKDLAAARETGEFTFWNNWPLSVDLTKDYPAPLQALAQHVDVENGDLFTDPQGILCAYQYVRVRDAKAFVAKLNTLLELTIQTGFAEPGIRGPSGRHVLDDDTRELVREFLRDGRKMLVLAQGRVEVNLPFSPADHAWLKQELDRHVLTNLPREALRRVAVAERRAGGGSTTDTAISVDTVSIAGAALEREIGRAPSYRFFWDNDVSVQRTQELTTIGIGVLGDEELRVVKRPEGLYHDALLQRLRTDGVKIEDSLPDQELERRFAEFRGRDAKLPAKLAALRD